MTTAVFHPCGLYYHAERIAVLLQQQFDREHTPEERASQAERQKNFCHQKVFEDSGLCAECGKWTKEKP